ncbi:MAG: DNA-processing protein DprA [Prevotellaceae bacterium]|nr:DNA-processing protein DprA [Prevotellaceae bacterium]
MSSDQEIIDSIALTRLNYFSLAGLLQLYRRLGSAREVIEHRKDIRDILPDAHPRLIEALQHIDEPLKRAEVEYAWDQRHGVHVLCLNDPDYPQRLKEVDDAPLVLFYKGNTDLNQRHVIDIVGTRRCTTYGQDIIRHFIKELKAYCPEVLIVSGLAYGVDICAHRNALENDFPTVGVLAHGLDDLYPAAHRETAKKMINNGGLITEFLTQTRAEKVNFIRRNRIVAGMSDATILVESAFKGGGLITTGIAQDYGRDVFAFPGPVINAPYSEGCNNLIRDGGAGLISSAEDFVKAMGWQSDAVLYEAKRKGIERQLFVDLSPEEELIVNALKEKDNQQMNMLTVKTNIPIGRLTALLFQLEMKGVVKAMAGGVYHLLS